MDTFLEYMRFLVPFISILFLVFYFAGLTGKDSAKSVGKLGAEILGILLVFVLVYATVLNGLCSFGYIVKKCGGEPGGLGNIFSFFVFLILLIVTMLITRLAFKIKKDEKDTGSTS